MTSGQALTSFVDIILWKKNIGFLYEIVAYCYGLPKDMFSKGQKKHGKGGGRTATYVHPRVKEFY